ncbi:hypothetical protein BDZ94DRAFT_1263993 [Collybia nuda]|uniref:Uncharacterized protein n=1 Tax=Collybia nuda TaxID=64659 RepID=A0A9P5Y578_9AGAR|nr:hypothetical protein BDZ94DRAFT_1263993 [Collybia nuda]
MCASPPRLGTYKDGDRDRDRDRDRDLALGINDHGTWRNTRLDSDLKIQPPTTHDSRSASRISRLPSHIEFLSWRSASGSGLGGGMGMRGGGGRQRGRKTSWGPTRDELGFLWIHDYGLWVTMDGNGRVALETRVCSGCRMEVCIDGSCTPHCVSCIGYWVLGVRKRGCLELSGVLFGSGGWSYV